MILPKLTCTDKHYNDMTRNFLTIQGYERIWKKKRERRGGEIIISKIALSSVSTKPCADLCHYSYNGSVQRYILSIS